MPSSENENKVTDRVLLIGKRAAVLTRLQAALREIGIEADLTRTPLTRIKASCASTARSLAAERSARRIAPG
jgi:hypothetical protein